jgi:hypothetical protein
MTSRWRFADSENNTLGLAAGAQGAELEVIAGVETGPR